LAAAYTEDCVDEVSGALPRRPREDGAGISLVSHHASEGSIASQTAAPRRRWRAGDDGPAPGDHHRAARPAGQGVAGIANVILSREDGEGSQARGCLAS